MHWHSSIPPVPHFGPASRSPANLPSPFLYGTRLAISNRDLLLLVWRSRQIVSLILFLGAAITRPLLSSQNHTTCTSGKPSYPRLGFHPAKWKLETHLPFTMPNRSAGLQLRSSQVALASQMRPKAMNAHSRRLGPHVFFRPRTSTFTPTGPPRSRKQPPHLATKFSTLGSSSSKSAIYIRCRAGKIFPHGGAPVYQDIPLLMAQAETRRSQGPSVQGSMRRRVTPSPAKFPQAILSGALRVVQCACQAGTRVQRSSGNTNNNNNQQELPTAQPYGVSDSPFPFKWVCGPQ